MGYRAVGLWLTNSIHRAIEMCRRLSLGHSRAWQRWQGLVQHAGSIPGGDLQPQMLHEPAHHVIHVAMDSQVSLAVLPE